MNEICGSLVVTFLPHASFYSSIVDECNGDDSMDGNQLSPCYYSMARSSAKGRSCLSSLGPCTYDEKDALDDRVFNPHEALNACISCGIHCHRVCAGPPWSCYNPDGEGEEEKWQCEDCR
ncbi:unnamed protein product [Angiostrongylus costaricensis]|uniref:PHD domain-containing protein n=1 Tax=Angiostrongylus costaricensis TaxID=334426 RepID=A0A0R3Q187_ANGCS|nr:unnamed protein product [Angiostrongylus costaricensis]